MKFNIGDRVRFLSSPGGGVVSKILSPSMVNVAIDDGFDIPTPVNDLVRIGEPGGAAARFFTDERKPKPQAAPEKEKAAPAPEPAPVADAGAADDSDRIMPLASGYRKAANPPGFYLAFVPQDQRWLITGQVDVFLVNLPTTTSSSRSLSKP